MADSINSNTVVNTGSYATQVNGGYTGTQVNEGGDNPLGNSVELNPGTVLEGGYTVTGRIGSATASGEADIFLCEKGGKKYSVKVFRRAYSEKDKLEKTLRKGKSGHIAKLYDTGEIYGRHFEVFDYFEKGSLADELKIRTFTMDELKRFVIPQMNEGLHELHSAGILHRDIKPSNIMWSNSGRSEIVFIDFGLSSVTDSSNSIVVSKIGFTSAYAAPEVIRNVYFDESDYYSMGIVLYELFTGKTPFGNSSTYTSVITKPGNMPEELYNLILGLTYLDLTYRHDKKNPNRRWTYDEVNQWLSGKYPPVPGRGAAGTGPAVTKPENARAIPRISFCENDFEDMDNLCVAMAMNWEEGKNFVFRKRLSGHLSKGKTEMCDYWVSVIDDINYASYSQDEKMIRILNKLYPEAPYIFTPFGCFEKLSEFAAVLLRLLESGVEEQMEPAVSSVETLLATKELSDSAHRDSHTSEHVMKKIAELEGMVGKSAWSDNRYGYVFELAYLLSDKPVLNPKLPDGKTFKNMDDLKKYLADKGSGDKAAFFEICSYFVDEEHRLRPEIFGWLKYQGYDTSGHGF